VSASRRAHLGAAHFVQRCHVNYRKANCGVRASSHRRLAVTDSRSARCDDLNPFHGTVAIPGVSHTALPYAAASLSRKAVQMGWTRNYPMATPI
jgi:hypothetical protein